MGSLNIEYPNIPSGTAETQLGHIKSYLYQLTEKLNLADFSAEKIFEDVSKAIDAENVATEGNEKAEKLKEYANLKALIIKTGDYAVRNSPDLKKTFESSFGASSDFGKYYEELKREVTENAEGIEDLFTYTAGINNPDGEIEFGKYTQQFIKTGLLYYDEAQTPIFGVGVGLVSSITTNGNDVIDMDSNKLATFTADEIAFWDQGTKVAYISGNAINFPAANIRGGSIHIGEDEDNKCFKVDTSGNLQLGKYFSVSNEGIAKFQNSTGTATLDLSAGDLAFALNDEVSMKQSAEGMMFTQKEISGGLTVYRYLGGISAYLNAGVGSDYLYPTSQMCVYDVYDPKTAKILGKFWDNGGTRSQLDINSVYLRDGGDMSTEYGSIDFWNDSARLRLCDYGANTYLVFGVNDAGSRIIDMYDSSNNLDAEMAIVGRSGQVFLGTAGNYNAVLRSTSDGGYLYLGGADDSWKVAWNTNSEGSPKSHLQADEIHFLGKTDGLITGTLSVSECSAYIVIGQPTSGGYSTTAIIPSDIATQRTWQIADEANYINFVISADGSISQVGGSSGSGSLVAAYSIR